MKLQVGKDYQDAAGQTWHIVMDYDGVAFLGVHPTSHGNGVPIVKLFHSDGRRDDTTFTNAFNLERML